MVVCSIKGECPMIPVAFKGTSIAAGKCVRCQHNIGNKKGKSRGRGRR